MLQYLNDSFDFNNFARLVVNQLPPPSGEITSPHGLKTVSDQGVWGKESYVCQDVFEEVNHRTWLKLDTRGRGQALALICFIGLLVELIED
uniref:GPN-loop GTPase 2 n=1 Tax=Steinernema glaseri TaxID=37863 RepID=A0A1I8A1Q4_9BILA